MIKSFLILIFMISQAMASPIPGAVARKRFDLHKTGLMWVDFTDTTTMTRVGNRIDEIRAKDGDGNVIGTAATRFVTNASTTNNPVYNSALFGGRGGIDLPSGAPKVLITPSGSTFPLNWNTGFTALVVARRSNNDGFFLAQDLAGGSQVNFLALSRSDRIGIGIANVAPQGVLRGVSGVFGMGYAGGGSGASLYRPIIDERIVTQNPGALQAGRAVAFDRLTIGGTGGATNGYIGEVAAYFFWPSLLTEAQLRSSVRWIKSRYGVVTPDKDPRFTIVIDGNSLANGETTKYNNAIYEGALAANGSIGQRDIRYFALGAQTTQQMTSRAAALIDPFYNEVASMAASRKIYIGWEGRNDLILNAIDATTCYNNIKALFTARKAAGWRTIVATILPTSTGVANFEANRLAVNQMIRDAKTANESWVDQVADVGGDATMGQTGQNTNVTYYAGDAVHLTTAGFALLAPYFTNAINAVTGL